MSAWFLDSELSTCCNEKLEILIVVTNCSCQGMFYDFCELSNLTYCYVTTNAKQIQLGAVKRALPSKVVSML